MTSPDMTRLDLRKTLVRFFLLLLLVVSHSIARAQETDASTAPKSLYIEAFTGGHQADALHDSLMHRISKSQFHLVSARKNADIILKGSGQVWVHGFVTTNSRTPENNRQAVYAGYLSLEAVDSQGQPLWSWLVTPGRFVWSNIVDNLATRGAKRLSESADLLAPTPASPANPSLAQTTILGAGATFPAPLYQKWFEDFEQMRPGVHIRYSPVGSQLGAQQLTEGQVDFAGSDVAPEEIVGPAKAAHLRRFATVLGAVVPIYNLNSVKHDLRFTAAILADIYLGRITRWNDSEIRRVNKGVDLPDAPISVIHRSDGSGTTWVWSDFLSKVSPAWSSSPGRGTTIAWPVGTGAEGNQGIVAAVRATPNSIGYVELTYAIQNQLSFGSVQNHAGEFVRADLDSLAAAAGQFDASAGLPPSIANPPGKDSYPIVSFTWLVVSADAKEPSKQAAFVELLRWILTYGQRDCSALGYAPLPRSAVEAQLRALALAH
jgi:phosphate ABC transporter phosphate-binding protein